MNKDQIHKGMLLASDPSPAADPRAAQFNEHLRKANEALDVLIELKRKRERADWIDLSWRVG
jgi:hypothetical protein